MTDLFLAWVLGTAVIWAIVFLVPWSGAARDRPVTLEGVLIAAAWPITLSLMVTGAAIDFASFVLAVLRKPH